MAWLEIVTDHDRVIFGILLYVWRQKGGRRQSFSSAAQFGSRKTVLTAVVQLHLQRCNSVFEYQKLGNRMKCVSKSDDLGHLCLHSFFFQTLCPFYGEFVFRACTCLGLCLGQRNLLASRKMGPCMLHSNSILFYILTWLLLLCTLSLCAHLDPPRQTFGGGPIGPIIT